MPTHLSPILALVITLAGASLCAQDLRLRDPSGLAAAVYDSARRTILALGSYGETIEFDGAAWRQRALPRHEGRMGKLAYDEQRRGTWLVGSDDNQQFVTSYFDGSNWHDLTLSTTPLPRTQFVLSYDGVRGEVVLFGGISFNHVFLDDTWVFDGSTWQQQFPNTVPPPRSNAGAAFDPNRGRLVVYGGQSTFQLRDTWEWNGTDWNMANIIGAPSIRLDPGMTYDPQRQRTLMFGGFDGFLHDDLWEWDGTSWSAVPSLPLRPAPRMNAAFVFDPHLGEAVLAGGSGNINERTFDAWSWNGTRWLLRTDMILPAQRGNGNLFASPTGELLLYEGNATPPTTRRWTGTDWSMLPGAQPPPRYAASSCTGQQLAYLYGGFETTNSSIRSDLWGYDGVTWQQLSSNGPANSLGAAMAYDWARGELVLFGGNGAQLSSDTWIFRNGAWQQASPTNSPSARVLASATFDFGRAAVVMHGGWAGPNNFLADAWQWDGLNWSPLPPAVPAPSLTGNQLAYDFNRGRCVLAVSGNGGRTLDAYELGAIGWTQLTIGDSNLASGFGGSKSVVGYPFANGLALGDDRQLFTLDLDEARTTDYGTACTTSAPVVAANTWPRPDNNAFAIDVMAAPATPLVALVLGLQSANTPLAGCTLHVANGISVLLPLNAAAFGSSSLPLPNDAAFLGLDVFVQAAALDSTGPAGVTLSRGLQLTIGS